LAIRATTAWIARAVATLVARMAFTVTGGGGLAYWAGIAPWIGHIVGSYDWCNAGIRRYDFASNPLDLPTLI